MNHILSVNQFDQDRIEKLFNKTTIIERNFHKGSLFLYPNRIMISFFGEPSTRTRFSFERAMYWLNGKVISESNSNLSSSLKKGESFKDTFKTLSQYGDLIVCRHNDEKWIDYAEYSSIPIINAGNGSQEHPTQSLLDLYTIKKELGRLNNLKVMFIGDLKYSRTFNSLIKLLNLYENNEIYTAPAEITWRNDDIKYYLDNDNLTRINLKEIENYLSEMDVIYFTRIQKERFDSNNIESLSNFQLMKKHLEILKEHSIILHALPRNDEISEGIDDDKRAIYHEKQIKNGIYIRVAIIQELLDE